MELEYLITGASSGIGKYLFATLLENGSEVYGTYHSSSVEDKYLDRFSKVDISDHQQVEGWISNLDLSDKVVLINCAGINYNSFMHKSSPEKWANIIGYTLENLPPITLATWDEYVHPDDIVESNKLLQDHLDGKTEIYESEFRMEHKNGEYVWILDKGKLVSRDSEGNPELIIGSHQEITEKKNTVVAVTIKKKKKKKQKRQKNKKKENEKKTI